MTTFARLKDEGLLQPLMDTPLPNLLPKNFKEYLFCESHLIPSHDINKCKCHHHEFQDLIGAKKLVDS